MGRGWIRCYTVEQIHHCPESGPELKLCLSAALDNERNPSYWGFSADRGEN